VEGKWLVNGQLGSISMTLDVVTYRNLTITLSITS